MFGLGWRSGLQLAMIGMETELGYGKMTADGGGLLDMA